MRKNSAVPSHVFVQADEQRAAPSAPCCSLPIGRAGLWFRWGSHALSLPRPRSTAERAYLCNKASRCPNRFRAFSMLRPKRALPTTVLPVLPSLRVYLSNRWLNRECSPSPGQKLLLHRIDLLPCDSLGESEGKGCGSQLTLSSLFSYWRSRLRKFCG
jgi:hypothetical protein